MLGTKVGRGMMGVGEVVFAASKEDSLWKGLLTCQCGSVSEGRSS